MKKVFRLENLDCANCAAKMESAIKKVDGVEDAAVNFITQKLTLVADESVFDSVLKKVLKVCRKVEPDCEIIL